MLSLISLLEEHIIFLALSFLLIFFLLKWSSIFSSKKSGQLPPSPPTIPIIGNLHQVGLYPHHSLRKLAKIYGPIMLLRLGSVPALVISSAEMAREIMKIHDINFSDRPKSRMFKILFYDQKDIVFSPYGENWRQMKSIAVVHLLSNKKVQSYRDVREEETNSMIRYINSSSSSSSPVVNLSEIFMNTANDIVCRLALGRKYEGTSLKDILREGVKLVGIFDVGDFIPWLAWVSNVKGLYAKAEKLAKMFDGFLENVLDQHVADGNWKGESKNKDFVDVLLSIQNENNGTGFPFHRTSIKAIIQDIFGAGTDTTYTVMEWVMTELLRHPNVMKKLQNEIRGIVDDKSDITEEDLNKIPYLKAVLKETLRLHPPNPLLAPRVANQDVRVKGFNIAAGTQVLINAYAIGRDAISWDQAEDFLPERFLNSSMDFKGQNFELIPFGAGRRLCPGIQFAMSINELVLAKLLHKFDWELHGATPQDLDMTETFSVTAHKKLPLLAVPTPYPSYYK